METKEKNFEADIGQYLLAEGGYIKGNMDTYDKAHALDMSVLIQFIEQTQPKTWARYQSVYGQQAEKQLYKIFQTNVENNSLIWVLRNGVKDRGMELRFCYFQPASDLNDELVQKYQANILTETRQFFYSTENNHSIDIVLSINGIPIVALELKNQLTGQSVLNAKSQYMYTRDPKKLLFQRNKRVLIYFCVDLYEAWMITELKGSNYLYNRGTNILEVYMRNYMNHHYCESSIVYDGQFFRQGFGDNNIIC